MKLINALAITLMALSSAAHADIVNSDWKVAGDNRAFTDEATGLKWLKLTETEGKSIDSILSNPNLYSGFRVANYSEVLTLFDNVYEEINVDGSFSLLDADKNLYESTSLLARTTTLDYVNIIGNTSVYKRAFSARGYSAGIDGYIKFSRLTYSDGTRYGYSAKIANNEKADSVYPDFTVDTTGVFMVNAEGVTHSLRPRPIEGEEDTWVNTNLPASDNNSGSGSSSLSDVSSPVTMASFLIAGGLFLRRRK